MPYCNCFYDGRVPSSGGAGVPNVGFFATRSLAVQAIPNISMQVVAWDTVVNDPGGDFTTGGSARFVAPTTGRYQLSASVTFDTGSCAGEFWLTMWINLTPYAQEINEISAGCPDVSMCVSFTPWLTAGQYVDTTVYQNTGFSQNITTTRNQFTGQQIYV